MIEQALDTDIGTDCDDAFALVYLLRNPKANLATISTVIGDPVIRAKIARKLERMLGSNVPIIAGECGPLDAQKYWTGIEEKALSDEEKKEEFVNSPYLKYTTDTRLICIAPLTNIALQLASNPTIRNVRDVYIMGSMDSSHNFKADLAAKNKVFKEGWNIYQVSKEVCEKIALSREELEQLRVNAVGEILCASAIRWLDYTGRDRAIMYDVLTASAGIGEGYVKFRQIEEGRYLSEDVDVELKDKLIEVIKQE